MLSHLFEYGRACGCPSDMLVFLPERRQPGKCNKKVEPGLQTTGSRRPE